MRTWHVHGVHRLTWVVLMLLVLAVAVFAMAAGFSRMRSRVAPVPQDPGPRGDVPPAAWILAGSRGEFPSDGCFAGAHLGSLAGNLGLPLAHLSSV